MNTKEVAEAFTAMLKAGDHHGAAQKFNAPDIVSIEAMDGPMARVQGTDAMKAKSDWWYSEHEVHSFESEGPHLNGDQFAVVFAMDFTHKASGRRVTGQEVGVYTVRDGKIVEERFFYMT
jgi:ketosteroid isomerase-like protein